MLPSTMRSGIMLYISQANSTLISRPKLWCGGVPSDVMFNVTCYARVWRKNRLYD